ncbi:ABC transporter permease [Salarchaeum sp. III]|uniref:ABC transporter permease n=1 Tax=Salarchaeum sp. III TaxID=3107927 RepID=UPI002EDAC3D2
MAATDYSDQPLADRITANPRPAVLWAAVFVALIAVELGAIAGFAMAIPYDVVTEPLLGALPSVVSGPLGGVLGVVADIGTAVNGLPTLLDRGLVPNQGYQMPDGSWESTFLGLSPAFAWALRLTLVYAYAFLVLYWVWRGYLVFREHYRYASWTPTDDMIDRLRGHSWGTFGLVIVFAFIVMAIFAPTISPTTANANIENPYGHEIQYYDEASSSVQTVTAGTANIASKSSGDSQNFGIGSYDKYDRFHPFGTLISGKDLFTFMAYGARVSLFIGLVAIGIAGSIAVSLALMSAYYKGVFDLATVLVSDSFQSMPQLLVLIMLSVALGDTWIAEIYSGAFVLALIFGAWGWTGLWRAVRGPAFQTVENEWVDAAESFGERADVLMRKHVAPYIVGYLLIYASMSMGGYMIATAGLSYIGIGVQPPTPEWGRAVSVGQNYIISDSWHISVLPGLAITTVVVGFNALGDGIRDAIDPQSEGAGADEVGATGGGA